MKQKLLLMTTLMMALNFSAFAKLPSGQIPPQPKHAGYAIKAKNGTNIQTKKGVVVQLRTKGFHKQPG